jgi:hypothetical protein
MTISSSDVVIKGIVYKAVFVPRQIYFEMLSSEI